MKAASERPAADRWLLIAFIALCVSTPFARPAILQLGLAKIQAADLLLPLVWLLGFVALMGRRRVPPIDRLLIAPLVFLLTLALSMVTAGVTSATAFIKLAAFAQLLWLPWLMSQFIREEDLTRIIVWNLRAGLAVTAVGLIGIVAFYVDRDGIGANLMCGWGGIKAGNLPRICAPAANPNLLINYLILITPLTFAHFATGLRPKSGGVSLLLWGGLACTGLIATLTMSAGFGGFAIALGWALIAWRRFHQLGPKWLNTLVGLAAAGLAVFFLLTMTVTLTEKGQGHISLGSKDIKVLDGMRPSIWKGLRLRERPLTGVGYGELPAITSDPRSFTPPDRLKDVVYPVTPRAMDAHNVALNVLGQAGVVGLLAFFWMLVEMTRGWLWARVRSGPPRLQLTLTTLALGFVGGFIYHGFLGSFEEARHLWPFVALAVAATRIASTSTETPLEKVTS